MIGRLLDMYFGLNGAIFTTSKKYKFDLIFTVILVGLVYGLKLYFIPWWGGVGAAISTALAIITYNLGRMIFVYKIYAIHPFSRNQLWVIMFSALCLIFGYFSNKLIDNVFLNLFSNLMILTLTFFVPIYVFKLESESINYIKKVYSFLKGKI
jgi:O-antigen/teichoic acid export membrane protein